MRGMAGAGAGVRDGRTRVVVVVSVVLVAGYVLATLGIFSMLGVLLLVVLGVAALVGRAIPSAHGWVAFAGVALAALGVALAALSLVEADDPWADLVLVLWVIVLGTLGCAWGAGIWLGRYWRSRSSP